MNVREAQHIIRRRDVVHGDRQATADVGQEDEVRRRWRHLAAGIRLLVLPRIVPEGGWAPAVLNKPAPLPTPDFLQRRYERRRAAAAAVEI